MNKETEHIMSTVSKATGYTVEQILSKSRKGDLPDVRTLAIYLLMKKLNNTETAKALKLHHTTIIWHVRKYRACIKYGDAVFNDLLKKHENTLQILCSNEN